MAPSYGLIVAIQSIYKNKPIPYECPTKSTFSFIMLFILYSLRKDFISLSNESYYTFNTIEFYISSYLLKLSD